MKVRKKIGIATNLIRHFGPGWVATRAGISLKKRFHWYAKRLPMSRWEDHPFESLLNSESRPEKLEDYLEYRKTLAPAFFLTNFDPHQQEDQKKFEPWDAQIAGPIEESEALLQGTINYFTRHRIETGFPPKWHFNMFTKESSPDDIHWSQIPDFNYGDIKVIWEPNRFSFTYGLVRAYYRTGDERYPEAFWKLVEDWRDHNPPQAGVNWKCGQEISLRIMAWCFGLYGFINSKHSTPQRVAQLAEMIGISARRIELAINYALSQSNNHSITESVGLWTVGLLFPEFSEALRWKNRGRELLESLAQSLIYDDGAFAQHSNNYHRTMLHDYLWAIGIGRLNEEPLSTDLEKRLQISGEFLHQIQDPESGKLPNYGNNDGALFLPLSNCSAEDYRPVIQAIQIMANGTRCFPSGPWDEEAYWLTGKQPDQLPLQPQQVEDMKQPTTGGYYTIRSADSYLFTRCASFRHRPAHADMLSVDLWYKGQNIALDAGTYSYNEKEPWSNTPLGDTCFHNTVSVDGKNQMSKVSRFLWMPWAVGTMLQHKRSKNDQIVYLRMMHDGYKRLPSPVAHTREIIRLGCDNWLIYDSLRSKSPHRYCLNWLLIDSEYQWNTDSKQILLNTPKGEYHGEFGVFIKNQDHSKSICQFKRSRLLRADKKSPRGWQSTAYYEKKPALSLELEVENQSIDFYTIFSPHKFEMNMVGDEMQIQSDDCNATITWDGAGIKHHDHIKHIVFESETLDELEISR